MIPENPERIPKHCPMLGGDVRLRYCLASREPSLPCHKIINCWWELFDIVTYLQTRIPPDVFETLQSYQPKPKVVSLVEIIAQAQDRISR